MANRMKEDERNEKIIRSLLKLPPNRKCINCNSLGPQYVCTNFWTFVCTTCSGIHREFTHRVKSVSMAKFTSQEVTSLQQGGNQKAKEIYFKDFDPQRHPLPDSSNVDRLRDFIKHVYVDKRYSGDRGGDRPPRGKTGDRDDASESRRPDSLRSDSRSPPYEDEYGERRYGDRSGFGARKFEYDRSRYDDRGGYDDRRYGYDERRSPGQYESDRSRYDRNVQDNRRYDDTYKRSPSNFESGGDKRFDDRSGNGNQNKRFEDRRFPDTSDRRRPEEQSPNYQRDYDITSPPPVRPVRDILGDDVPTLRVSDFPRANGSRDIEGSTRSMPEARREFRGQRTASSSSMGSVEGNSPNLNRANSASLIDFSAEPEPPTATAQQDPFGVSSITQPSTATQQDPFSVSSVKQQSTAAQQDPFAVPSVSRQSSAVQQVFSAVSQPSAASASDNGGWATFDFAPQAAAPAPLQSLAPAPVPAAAAPVGPIAGPSTAVIDSFGKVSNAGQWSAQWAPPPQVQGPATSVSGGNNWSAFPQSVQPVNGVSDSQSWNTLLSSAAPAPPNSSQNVQPAQPATKPPQQGQGQHPAGSTQNGRNEIPEDLFKLSYPEPVLHNAGFQLGSQLGGVSGLQFPSVGVSLPGSVPYYHPPSKSTNPFDIAGELPATQGSTFPSMGSLQAALPNSNAALLAAHGSGPGAFNTQWTPSLAPTLYQPAASGLYMGQQASNTFAPKVQSGVTPPITSFPSGSFPSDDLFFNLGAPRLSSQSSLPSVGGNPFG